MAYVVGFVLSLAACTQPLGQASPSPSESPSAAASPTASVSPTLAESPTPAASPSANPSPSPAKLIITSVPFHMGEVGVTYSTVALGAAGGVKPYKWSISEGALPPGLLLSSGGSTTVGAVIAAIACILGHNFTIWLGFKGGKGMATSFGVVIALFSPFVVIAAVLVWLIVFFVGRFVSLASILAAVALPIAVIFLGGKTGNDFWILITFSILAAAMAILRHRSNISRLLNGTESRFGKK